VGPRMRYDFGVMDRVLEISPARHVGIGTFLASTDCVVLSGRLLGRSGAVESPGTR